MFLVKKDIFYWIKQKGKTPFDVRIYYQTTDVDEVLRLGLKQIGGCFHCLLDGDLDPGTAAFREPQKIAGKGKAVLVISHDGEFLNMVCTRILSLSR